MSGEKPKANFVQTWLDRTPDASWEKLVAGLRKINKNSLAAEIESEHLSRALVPHSGSPSFPSTAPASASPSEVGTTDPISNDVFCQEVVTVKVILEQLQDEFYEVMTRTHSSLSDQEKIDNSFLDRFRDYLLVLPVAKRQVHIRFFIRNEDEILAAETIKKLFAIVSRYCNYTNYEIIFHIVKRFCHELKRRMLKYRDSLTSFEKSTAVDVYLSAISAHPGGAIRKGYIRMTMKINKPPSECKLYEIRELKESIEENAALESHATYIETPLPGSVVVRLLVPEEVGWRVGVVLMSPAFREKRLTYVSTYSTRHLLKDYLKGELQVASGKGDVEAVISLSAVADPYWIGVVTMMMAVEKFGNAEVISRLLQPGANIDVQDKEGNSLLMIATRMGWTDVVSLLINAGAALDLQNKVQLSDTVCE
ncbi:Putative ankyrin repeat protein RP714 [Geodia barretti]|uniref:Ankyrin repeat protein RP714 n=1 Tax=Geodia barretti TaxID=519541 RepID=A0AA35W9U2_GEOBA|nr:Putative ankyrin repeat protein RP714 [Geodia barretti]